MAHKQKKKPLVTEREVRLARSFLAATGGNATNGYLLLAIIAWMRMMRRSGDPYWKRLARYSPQSAGRMLAAHLRKRLGARDERLILKALRGKGTGEEQGLLFIHRLERSDYDRHHYGYRAPHDSYMETKKVWVDIGNGLGYWDTKYIWHDRVYERNPMAVIWESLKGTRMPPKWFSDTVAVAPQPKPRPVKTRPAQPRSLQHVLPKPEYIQPYAARNFYDERPHLGDSILQND